MSAKLLFVFGEREVKKVVPASLDISAGDLRQLAANSFNLEPELTDVKHFDSDFEEWVLITDDFKPTDKERLKVVNLDIVR